MDLEGWDKDWEESLVIGSGVTVTGFLYYSNKTPWSVNFGVVVLDLL